nr:retropepsin-like aspartic protease [Marinibactrum halimedae]
MAEQALGERAVPLQQQGDHYVVGAVFDDGQRVNLILDTGASLSVISESSFNSLSGTLVTKFIRTVEMNTAGGVVSAPVYEVEAFAVDEYAVKNMQFAVMSLENMASSDGLLGMNYLREFAFRIDQKNKHLVLAPN